MTIRTKLFLLIILLCVPLLLNLVVLGLLARTVTRSVHQIQDVAVDQQALALRMQALLRDAEAALYRHQLEGTSAFAVQFAASLGRVSAEIESFRSLATSPQELAWAEEMRGATNAAKVLGTELIALRERQSTQSARLLQIEAAGSRLLREITLADSGNLPFKNMVGVVANDLNDVEFYIAEVEPGAGATDRGLLRTAVLDFRRHIQELRGLARSEQELAWTAALDDAFQQLGRTGVSLINGQDQQRAQFDHFTGQVSHLGQELLAAQIQPYMTGNLVRAQDRLFATLNRAMLWSSLLSLLVVVAALASVAVMLRRITGDIETLLHGADRVAVGDLQTPVALRSDDELAQLGVAFNTMMGEIGAREQRLQQRIVELERLREISLRLTSVLALGEVLQTVADSSLDLVHAAEAHLFLCTDDAPVPVLMASAHRTADGPVFARMPRDAGLVARTALAGTPQVASRPLLQYADDNREPRLVETMAAAAFPLLRGATVTGVFNVTLDDRETFRPSELHLLGLLADQAAAALENARLYANVAEKEASLNSLVQKLSLVQEEERRLVGLDLHDGLTQVLLSANMHLNTLATESAHLPAAAQTELAFVQARLREAIDEVRWVVSELRPTELEDYGLVDGLQHYVARLAQQEGWQTEFVAELDDVALPANVETALFRIAQEALSNTRKHAATARVRIALTANGTGLQVSVRDWGRGFDQAKIAGERMRLGLVGMQERAELVGGKLHITSAPGAGTEVLLMLPAPYAPMGAVNST